MLMAMFMLEQLNLKLFKFRGTELKNNFSVHIYLCNLYGRIDFSMILLSGVEFCDNYIFLSLNKFSTIYFIFKFLHIIV